MSKEGADVIKGCLHKKSDTLIPFELLFEMHYSPL